METGSIDKVQRNRETKTGLKWKKVLRGLTVPVVMTGTVSSGQSALGEEVFMGLEEIIVTARKREERLIDTPIAMTAVSDIVLQKRNLKDLTGLSQVVPNLVFDLGTGSTGGSSNAQIFVRGIGQQDFLFTSDPGVGLYIDGVYFPRATGVVMDLVNLEQVEVLRGPQGTLFGKNTIGGAINITTKKPGNELSAFGQAIFGSRDRIDVQGSIGVPVVQDKLSVMISASSRNQDGYVKRINAGDRLGDTDSLYGRFQARWTPSETLTLDLSADVTRKRETSAPEEPVEVRAGDPSNVILGLWNALVAPTYGPGIQMDSRYLSDEFESKGTGPNYSDFDMFGVSLTINKEINDNLSVKSITAYRDQDSQFANDADHSPLKFTETSNDNEHEQFSQEVQFTGTSLEGRLKWVFGGFYMHEKGHDQFDAALGSGLYSALEALPAALIPLGPVACPPGPGQMLPCAGGAGNPLNVGFDLDAVITDDIKIDSYAVFGEMNYDLTNALNLTAGVRYSYDKKDFTTSLFRKTAGVYTLPETTVVESWDRLSPRVGLKYNIDDDAMVYISATGGFKSGGFNGRAKSLEEVDSFDPEKVWAYEVGTKFVLLDNRLGVNAAAFYNEYKDMQLLSLRDVGGLLVVVTENAGEVEIKGVELEVVATPVNGLNLRTGLGYLDAKYTELAPSATISLDDDLVKTPKWTLNGGFDYTLDLGNSGSVTFGGSVYYRSTFANELTNEPSLMQSGYALFDAFLQYTDPSDRWSITAFGINLGDKRYKTNALASFGSFGQSGANYGAPREWGVKLRFTL